MIERVYKYPLAIEDWVSIRMPQGAEPLCVQVQNGAPYLWAKVQIDQPIKGHLFRVAGTGHDLGSSIGRYIGTIQPADGDLIFHVFASD